MGRVKGSKNPQAAERYKEIGKANGQKSRDAQETTVQKKAGAPPIYVNPALLAYRIARYMVQMDSITWINSNGRQKGKPYTMAGAKIATGINDRWYDYVNGSRDGLTEQVRKDGPIMCKGGVQDLSTDMIVDNRYIPYTMLLLGDPDAISEDYNPTPERIREQANDCYMSEVLRRYALIVEGQREQDLYDKGRTSDIFIHKARYGWQDETVITSKREIVTSAEARELLNEVMQLPEYKE